jgi:hypothetical protein
LSKYTLELQNFTICINYNEEHYGV